MSLRVPIPADPARRPKHRLRSFLIAGLVSLVCLEIGSRFVPSFIPVEAVRPFQGAAAGALAGLALALLFRRRMFGMIALGTVIGAAWLPMSFLAATLVRGAAVRIALVASLWFLAGGALGLLRLGEPAA